MSEIVENSIYKAHNDIRKQNHLTKKEKRKSEFEYLKFDDIQVKIENNIIWILEQLNVNPKIIKNDSVKYLIDLLKTIIDENDELETMKIKIYRHIEIENKIVIFSDEEFDYIWEVLEDPPDGVCFKKISKKKKSNKKYLSEEEIILNKNSREISKKYLEENYEDDILLGNIEITIKYLKELKGTNEITLKNLFNNNRISFIIENSKKKLINKEQVFEYLDKNKITFHRRILKDKNAKVLGNEEKILSEQSQKTKERLNSGRQRGGFYRTRFDSAETDD